MQINPVWTYGPYNPAEVSAGSQPDWYIGYLEGALRIMPDWEWHLGSTTWSWNIFIPAIIGFVALPLAIGVYPFLEKWITGDDREHHVRRTAAPPPGEPLGFRGRRRSKPASVLLPSAAAPGANPQSRTRSTPTLGAPRRPVAPRGRLRLGGRLRLFLLLSYPFFAHWRALLNCGLDIPGISDVIMGHL